jgi:hypothetical protein
MARTARFEQFRLQPFHQLLRRARPGIAATTNLDSEPLYASVARLHYPRNFSATAVPGGRRLVLSEALRPARIAPLATPQNLKLSTVFQNMETKRFCKLEAELKVTGVFPMHSIGRVSRGNLVHRVRS